MVTINAEHTLDYFASYNGVAISAEDATIIVEEITLAYPEVNKCIDEAIDLLCSPPSNWPQ